jgi:hypothetical protein
VIRIELVSEAGVQEWRWVDSSLDLAPIEAPEDCTFANLICTQSISICRTQSGTGALGTCTRRSGISERRDHPGDWSGLTNAVGLR